MATTAAVPLPATGPLLDATVIRTNSVRRIAAQSLVIHPDWDADTLLSYLEHDAFAIDGPDDVLVQVAWPDGPRAYPARAFAESWVRHRERLIEHEGRAAAAGLPT